MTRPGPAYGSGGGAWSGLAAARALSREDRRGVAVAVVGCGNTVSSLELSIRGGCVMMEVDGAISFCFWISVVVVEVLVVDGMVEVGLMVGVASVVVVMVAFARSSSSWSFACDAVDSLMVVL